jgi:LCP family protein required for cell wall assembly
MKLLLIGLDSDEAGYNRGFADVIRVARINFVNPSALLLAVPRDLWVTVPGLSDRGINEERIKMAYPYGNVYGIPGGGPSLLARTLTLNLGLRVDHYAAIDFTTFAAGIDRIGGIDIYVPIVLGDPDGNSVHFSSGWNHMDGRTALAYARIRPDNTSDLQRIDRQNQVINAAREKMLNPQTLPMLPTVIGEMRQSVATDLSPSDLSSLLCIMEKTGAEKTVAVTIDKPLVLPVTDEYGYERLLPDQRAIRSFIRSFDSGDVQALRNTTAH